MDKLLLPILIFLTFNFKGQNPLNKAYKGLPDGDKVDYYSNLQVRTMCTIKNGNVVGKHINYFKNGNLRSLEVFDNGLFNGTNFTLNKNGDTIVVEKYVHDTLLYYKELHYYKTGQIKFVKEAIFKDSLKINSFNESKNGLIYIQFNIHKLIANQYNENTYLKYYKSGRLLSIYFGVKGKINGVYKEFYENGQVRIIAQYINDKLNGNYLEYGLKGEIKKNVVYKNGKLEN